MRKQHIMLVSGAAAVLAFGVWLGHTASSSPAAPTATSVTIPTPAPRVARATTPTLASRPVAPGLAIDLKDPDPKVRRAAIAEVSDPQLLLAASRDGNVDVAVAATEGLGTLYRDGRITAKELAERITDHALADKVRVTAMNGLGLVTSPEGASLLTELLSRGTDLDRRSAAILLVHQDPMTAVPALISALGDADEVVRGNAHESLHAFARGHDFGQDAAAWQRWWQSRAI
jgi:hypothetical protein